MLATDAKMDVRMASAYKNVAEAVFLVLGSLRTRATHSISSVCYYFIVTACEQMLPSKI